MCDRHPCRLEGLTLTCGTTPLSIGETTEALPHCGGVHNGIHNPAQLPARLSGFNSIQPPLSTSTVLIMSPISSGLALQRLGRKPICLGPADCDLLAGWPIPSRWGAWFCSPPQLHRLWRLLLIHSRPSQPRSYCSPQHPAGTRELGCAPLPQVAAFTLSEVLPPSSRPVDLSLIRWEGGLKRPHGNQETVGGPSRANALTAWGWG